MDQMLLRATDLAAALGISRSMAYQLMNSNSLPGIVRLGRSLRISKRALDEWIDRQVDGTDRLRDPIR